MGKRTGCLHERARIHQVVGRCIRLQSSVHLLHSHCVWDTHWCVMLGPLRFACARWETGQCAAGYGLSLAWLACACAIHVATTPLMLNCTPTPHASHTAGVWTWLVLNASQRCPQSPVCCGALSERMGAHDLTRRGSVFIRTSLTQQDPITHQPLLTTRIQH